MSMPVISRRGAVTAIAASTLALLCAPRAAQAADAVIRIDNFTFNPAMITIPSGTTVTFENGDDIPHTIVIMALKTRSKPLDTGDSFSFTFTTTGSFEYFCGLHPHMKGMIIVTP
jgi:plastocyanin